MSSASTAETLSRGGVTKEALWCWGVFFAVCLTYCLWASDVWAQTTTDVVAPLDVLRTARTRAQSSNLNVASAKAGGENAAGLILVAMGVMGIAGASISGYSLYNNVSQGEQARGSNMTYLAAVVIAALLSIIAVIVGAITYFASAT